MLRFDFRHMPQNLFLGPPPLCTSSGVRRLACVIGGRTILKPAVCEEAGGPSASSSSSSIISKNLDTVSDTDDGPGGSAGGSAARGGVSV